MSATRTGVATRKRHSAKTWRYSRDTKYHYWGNDKYDYGHIFPTVDGLYGASTPKAFMTFKLLRDAKAFVEKKR